MGSSLMLQDLACRVQKVLYIRLLITWTRRLGAEGLEQAGWEMVLSGPEARPALLGLVQVWGWPAQGQGPQVRVWAEMLQGLQELVQESLQQRQRSACHISLGCRASQGACKACLTMLGST